MAINYHEMREISKEKARELVRKVLKNAQGNVSKTERILKIARKTVREHGIELSRIIHGGPTTA